MSARIGRRILISLIGCLAGVRASAGPYFNADRASVSELSREAVAQLNDARIAVIEMFTALDAGKRDDVERLKKAAVEKLKSALAKFQEVAENVGTKPLDIKPRSDEEERLVAEFKSTLAHRKIPFPQTESELAQLAVTIVESYYDSIDKADFVGFPKKWQSVRQIILSEIDLLYVGNLASIVWVLSASAS